MLGRPREGTVARGADGSATTAAGAGGPPIDGAASGGAVAMPFRATARPRGGSERR